RDAGGAFLGIAADGRSGWDGVRLGAIVPGSAAERAGLRAGDVLVRLDETGLAGFADLRAVLDRRRPGDALALVYLRDGVVTLTRFPLLHLALDVEAADGRRVRGFAADNLPPKWFDKDPARTFRDNVE